MKVFLKGIIEKCTRTVGDKNEIDDIMSRALVLQRFMGSQILDPNWSWKKSLPHQLIIGLLVIYVIMGTLEVANNTDDIKLIAEGAYTGMIILMMTIRFYLFLNSRHDFRKLYIQLKGSLYKSLNDDSEKNLKDVLRKNKTFIDVMLVVMLFPIALYVSTALWYYVNGERRTLSRSTSILMPMTTPYYEIGLIIHGIFMTVAGYALVLVDLWFMMVMIFFCTVCDVAVKKLNVEKKRNERRLEYAARLNDSLRKFYKSHVELVDFLNTFNAMFKWMASLPLICVAFSMCILFLIMSKERDFMMASNIVPNILELSIFNWFGEQVQNKALDWRTALLEFDWICLLPKDKKSYFILVFYMQKDIGLKTATGGNLSFLTMSASLKLSYQVFTVLENTET